MTFKISPALWLQSFSPVVLPILLIFAGVTFVGALISAALGLMMAVLLGIMIAAYRDPPRAIPQGDDLVLAPLDGVMAAITPNRGLPLMFDQAQDQVEHFTSIITTQYFLSGRTLRAPITGSVVEIINMATNHDSATKPSWFQGDDVAVLMRDKQDIETALVIHGYYIPHQIRLSINAGDTITAGDHIGIILGWGQAELIVTRKPENLARTTTHRVHAGETILAGPNQAGLTTTRTV